MAGAEAPDVNSEGFDNQKVFTIEIRRAQFNYRLRKQKFYTLNYINFSARRLEF